jgi:cell division protein FtsB
MDYLKRKQTIRGRLYGKTVKIILVIILLVLIRPTWNIYKKSRESEANLKRAEQELNSLEQRKNELSKNLESIKSEEGRDEEIRGKLGVAKEGETVVVIVEDKKEPEPVVVPVKPSALSQAWSRVLSWFGVK